MSQIKEAFPSRFEGGVILEADFSQLEVIGVAILSQDPVLIADILSGMDMHRVRAADLFNKPIEEVTDKERQTTKRLSFQLQYGAGAPSMAKKLEIPKETAQRFVDQYYGRYEVLKEWQDKNMEAVKRSRKPTGERLPSGLPQGRGELESATGRIYAFLEKDKPPGWQGRDKEPDFNPPEVKNYPSQGFATGDVMALFRGKVFRKLLHSDLWKKALLINTVHDSVLLDCESLEVAYRVKALLEETAAELPALLTEYWDLEVPVPFKIECKAGPTWGSTTKM